MPIDGLFKDGAIRDGDNGTILVQTTNILVDTHVFLKWVWPSISRYGMLLVQTSTRPPTHAPQAYQTWKGLPITPYQTHLNERITLLWITTNRTPLPHSRWECALNFHGGRISTTCLFIGWKLKYGEGGAFGGHFLFIFCIHVRSRPIYGGAICLAEKMIRYGVFLKYR